MLRDLSHLVVYEGRGGHVSYFSVAVIEYPSESAQKLKGLFQLQLWRDRVHHGRKLG